MYKVVEFLFFLTLIYCICKILLQLIGKSILSFNLGYHRKTTYIYILNQKQPLNSIGWLSKIDLRRFQCVHLLSIANDLTLS